MTIKEKENKFKEILRSIINKNGSLNKAANAMGIDSAYLSRRLNPNSHNGFKKPPKPDTLRKIANICDTNYITLMWLCNYFTDEEYELLLKVGRKEEKIMDIIDIKLIQDKAYLELTTMEMESWSEKRKHAKKCYVDTLKIKQLKDTDPERYAKIVEYMTKHEEEFENIMLEEDIPYHERIMKKIRET